MEDPANEIVRVVKLFTTGASPDIQKAAIERFFAPDAGLQHPLCTVAPGPGSRNRILGVYQWYRVMSPHIDLEVKSFSYDESTQKIYLNVTQTFHLFLSFFSPSPAKLLVRVSLRHNPSDGHYYISQQEDFYQPEGLLQLTIPPLVPLLAFIKLLVGLLCGMLAATFQCFGFWRIDPAGLPGPSSPIAKDYKALNGNGKAGHVNGTGE